MGSADVLIEAGNQGIEFGDWQIYGIVADSATPPLPVVPLVSHTAYKGQQNSSIH
jgi:hypothetical protein